MLIVKCPSCACESNLETDRRPLAGVRREWSDGLWDFQKPAHCRLARCPHCDFIFWIHRAERKKGESPIRLQMLGFGNIREVLNEAYESHPLLLAARNEEVLDALNNDLPIEDVSYLWRELWRRCNHPDRGIDIDFGQPISEQLRESIRRTVLAQEEAKPSDDRDILIEAELLRELGRFDEALARMEMAVCAGAPRALVLQAQTVAGNRKVCIVREDDSVVVY